MKPPKSEPYQRSRHRATLHAWVVAATAVASVGLPSAALAQRHEDAQHETQSDAATPSRAAHHAAADWLSALQRGDREAVWSAMRLPRHASSELAIAEELDALADWLSASGAAIEPVAHRDAGHWALSAWRFDAPADPAAHAGLIEPITLYNPAADDPDDPASRWEVVPQGFADDPALAPLYNADYEALLAWFETLR